MAVMTQFPSSGVEVLQPENVNYFTTHNSLITPLVVIAGHDAIISDLHVITMKFATC